MDEDIKKRLLESTDVVIDLAKQGGEFVAEQAPLIAQEIVNWGIASYACLAIIFIFFWGLFLYLGIKLRKLAKNENIKDMTKNDREFIFGFGWAITVCCNFLFIGVFINLYHMLFVIFAPRLYILETLADLTRNIR